MIPWLLTTWRIRILVELGQASCTYSTINAHNQLKLELEVCFGLRGAKTCPGEVDTKEHLTCLSIPLAVNLIDSSKRNLVHCSIHMKDPQALLVHLWVSNLGQHFHVASA